MSVDCTITVEDRENRVQIYRRHNGYPDGSHGVLATLSQAYHFAWSPPRFSAMDFAAALVRAWKPIGGGEIYIAGSTLEGKSVDVVACFDYIIRPAGKPSGRHLHENTGEPIVEVVDLTPGGWLEEIDKRGIKLKPSLSMPLSRAYEVGLKMLP